MMLRQANSRTKDKGLRAAKFIPWNFRRKTYKGGAQSDQKHLTMPWFARAGPASSALSLRAWKVTTWIRPAGMCGRKLLMAMAMVYYYQSISQSLSVLSNGTLAELKNTITIVNIGTQQRQMLWLPDPDTDADATTDNFILTTYLYLLLSPCYSGC